MNRLLLWALGFSAAACGDDPQVCMYGTPHVDLSVAGRVTDSEGVPIPGIEVGRAPEHSSIPFQPIASTGADGRYEIETSAFPGSLLDLRFVDSDGEANGGDFASQELRLKFGEEDRVKEGDGPWYGGAYARRDADVKLERKTAGEDEE